MVKELATFRTMYVVSMPVYIKYISKTYWCSIIIEDTFLHYFLKKRDVLSLFIGFLLSHEHTTN